MTGIGQAVVLIVVSGFIVFLASAAGFVIGRFVGDGIKTVLVSLLTALGLARDTATMVAVTVELIATTVSLFVAFVVFFSVTGLFDRGLGRDLLSRRQLPSHIDGRRGSRFARHGGRYRGRCAGVVYS